MNYSLRITNTEKFYENRENSHRLKDLKGIFMLNSEFLKFKNSPKMLNLMKI